MTEAINANFRSEPLFSLIDPDAPQAVRDHLLVYNKVVHPGSIALLPFISGNGRESHITLLIMQIEIGGQFRADHSDSSPTRRQQFRAQGNEELDRLIEDVVKAGWYDENTKARFFHVHNQARLADRAEKHRKWCCDVHVILNGWASALGLELNREARINDQFYLEAVELINHVVRGSVSSAVVVAFFACYAYITDGQRVEAGRTFARSVGLALPGALRDRVREHHEAARMDADTAAAMAASIIPAL